MNKQLRYLFLIFFSIILCSSAVFAQFPYSESFMNSTAPGINFGGSPVALLTSGNIDPNGNGFLRLTSNSGNQRGYAFSSNSFPSSKGISVSFEYDTYGGNGADGICFFLFDASVADANFNIGSYGGGLGYTNISAAGLSRAYLGIGLDEFGNFCTTNAGGSSGPTNTTKQPNSVTIRGAYNDPRGPYYMLNTVQLSQSTHGFSTIGSTGTTRVTTTGTGYRKAYIDILPDASGVGFDITVKIQHDAVTTPVTIINNYYYNYASPASLKFGYAASTGGSDNYHEIRNTGVTLPAGTTLSSPTQTNQTLTTCSNSTGTVNISSGFTTTNSPNGVINTTSVDLDPATSGIQTSFVVAKGTFTSDANANITFTPLNSTISGTAVCNFNVSDNYGATSNTATCTATINTAPNFTVNNPAAVCSPATVDLTAAAVTSGSSGLSLSYYTDAAATALLSNPAAVSSSGTYYIKGTNASNCSLILPVTVTINPLPTTSNAGNSQTVNTAVPASATLNGNQPASGTGSWSEVSGPTTAVIANPALYNTTVSSLNPGSYVFRWTITNNCGTSSGDVTITVTGTQSITFAALPAKTYGDADFNAGATASSGLPVTYSSSNTAVATIAASGNIHILSAGTTTITASQAGNGSYSAATAVQQNLVVNKAPLTITADNQAKAYGAANPTLTISYNGFVNAETSTNLSTQPVASTTANAASAVGSYPITVNGAASNNYSLTYTNGVLTVGQAAQVITFNTLAANTYGDADFTLTASSSSGLPVSYNSSDGSVASISGNTVHILKAGNVIITASQTGNSSYSAAVPVSQTLNINQALLTISANSLNKIYGAANPALAVSYSGFVNGDTPASLTAYPVIATAATTASAAGTYPISVSGASSPNYQISYANGVFTIAKSNSSVTFNALAAKTYGSADFNANAAASSGLAISYSSSNPAVATVDAAGVIHILSAGSTNITALQNGDGNYNAATPVSQTLTVNKALLRVKADNNNMTYGTTVPTLTISYSGFVNGDNDADLNPAVTISTAATSASAVGLYPITVSGAGSNNYSITYTGGTMTIVPNAQTITFTPITKTYGDPDFTVNATASSGLPVTYQSYNTAIATVDQTGLVHITGAGLVQIAASQAGNGNFIPTTVIKQPIIINKAPLTIIADDVTKDFGDVNPAFTFSYSSFVNGDDASILTSPATATTTAVTASAVGDYPIIAGSAASDRYLITFQQGTLHVVQHEQTLSAATTSTSTNTKTYGDPDFNLNVTSSANLPLTYTSSDPTIATVDDAGNVHILKVGAVTFTVAQPGNANFNAVTMQQVYTVNPAVITVTADNKTKAYGDALPALTYVYTGFVNAETSAVLSSQATTSTTATATSPLGNYPIKTASASADNYTFNYADGTLTVTKAVLTITADAKSRAYGDANPVLTYTYSGFINNDTPGSLGLTPSITTTATATSAMGTYPINISGVNTDSYTINYVAGLLTVTKPMVTSISLSAVTLYENRPAGTSAGTLSASSADPNAVFTYTLVAGTGDTDNAMFKVAGDKIVTSQSLNYENLAKYSIVVRATNQYGAYIDQIFTINILDVNEVPTMAAIADQKACFSGTPQTVVVNGITAGPEDNQQTTISISATNPYLFNSINVSGISNGSAVISYMAMGSGASSITVTVKDNGGTANGGVDTYTQTFLLTVNDAPVATILPAKTGKILKGETIALTASGGSAYSWKNDNSIAGNITSASISVRPAETTTYTVTVSNSSGCTSTVSYTVEVLDNYALVKPANIVTPNGDGKNDTWLIQNIDLYPGAKVAIFDQGGRKLFETTNYANSWDATYGGTQLAEGTYYYVIDFGANIAVKKGFITVLRNR